MECPRCQSSSRVKSGFMKGTQRYKCKSCGCNYTVDYGAVDNKERKRRFALSMYLEGLGFHSIGRLLGVSHVSVLNWVRKYGRELESIRNPRPCKVMELDEMHSYVGHKKTTDGFGLGLIEMPDNTLIWLSETEVPEQGRDSGRGSATRQQES